MSVPTTCFYTCRYCLIWEAHGYCKTKSKYMKRRCPAACRQCQTTPIPKITNKCTDHHDYCKTWATHQMCTLRPVFMKANCRKSCGKNKVI